MDNLAADLPTPPLPPLGADGKPISTEALRAVFPDNLIEQEASTRRWIDVPEEILVVNPEGPNRQSGSCV